MQSDKYDIKSKKEKAALKLAILKLQLTQKVVATEIGRSPQVVSDALSLKTNKKALPTLLRIKSFLAIEILKSKKNGRS